MPPPPYPLLCVCFFFNFSLADKHFFLCSLIVIHLHTLALHFILIVFLRQKFIRCRYFLSLEDKKFFFERGLGYCCFLAISVLKEVEPLLPLKRHGAAGARNFRLCIVKLFACFFFYSSTDFFSKKNIFQIIFIYFLIKKRTR